MSERGVCICPSCGLQFSDRGLRDLEATLEGILLARRPDRFSFGVLVFLHPARYLYHGPMWRRRLAAWWLPKWAERAIRREYPE